jgi:alanine racemase
MPFKNCKRKELASLSYSYKLDTGMHRLGFEEDSIEELIATLKGNDNVQIRSILSHLPQVMI